MPLFPAVVLMVAGTLAPIQTDRTETLGRSYAQILAMGESKWTTLYGKERGDSTPAMAAAFITYGDALGWRNDRLAKGGAIPLRKPLTAFTDELQTVGFALTEGGTIWNIFAAQMYRDVETTLHRVLTHKGTASHHVVSEVTRALEPLDGPIAQIPDSKRRARARAAMTAARKAFGTVVARSRGLSRRDSDTVLEFCRDAARAVREQTAPR